MSPRPVKPDIIAEIIDIVASHGSKSLTNFRLAFNIMPTLPVELIERIIDIVAQCSPESLTNCALVSRRWTPRSEHHFNRIFRTPIISTFDSLHDFLDVIQRHPHLATFAASLEVVPVPELNPSHASYVPFLNLAPPVLPNIRHLILGETLHWNDYPPLYRNGTVGSLFHSIVSLDMLCHCSSISDLLRAVQSFRNVQHVRLIYPHHDPPQWVFSTTTQPSPRRGPSYRETFRLQSLELSLALVAPILGVIGDSIVNLSVICPEMSTVSTDTPESKRLSGLSCSWALLQTVKITVPMETPSDDLEHYGGLGLGRLDLLLAPITKSNVGCSMSLVRCREHDTVGYRVEDVTVAELRKIILTAKGFGKGPLEDCQKCRNKDTTAQHLGHLEDMTGRHACPYPGCHSIFALTHNLKFHVREVHLDKRSHVCSEPGCSRAFGRKHDLLRHHQSAHAILKSPRSSGNLAAVVPGLTTAMELNRDAFVFDAMDPALFSLLPIPLPESQQEHAVIEEQETVNTPKRKRRQDTTKRFPCPHPGCGSMFARANNLKVHVDSVHLRKREHVCGEPGCSCLAAPPVCPHHP